MSIPKKKIRFLLAAFMLVGVFVFTMFCDLQSARADITPYLHYQGKLNKTNGQPVKDESYQMRFRLYESASGGGSIWSDTQTVETKNGTFSVLLEVDPNDIQFDKDTYYLGVQVGDDSEMSPRKRMASVPQAYNANNLRGDGHIKITGDPEGSDIEDATAYINPSSAGSSEPILALAVDDSERFVVYGNGNADLNGDFTAEDIFADRIGVGTTSPTAFLDLSASTTAQASMRVRSGVMPVTPNEGDIYSDGTDLFYYNGATWDDLTAAGGGVTAFTALTDTPGSYAGMAGYLVRVNSTPDELEFFDASSWDQDSSNDLTTSTSWGGDLSATGASPTVARINGATLGTTTATPANILVANASNAWTSVTMSGDVAINSTGVITIQPNAVALGTDVTGILPAANGGTGVNGGSAGNGTFLIGNGSGFTLATLTEGVGMDITNASGSVTLATTLGASVDLASEITGTLPVGNGGTGTATQFTQGSIVFAGASGVYSQDNANFFFDNTNDRLGIGTNTPTAFLDLPASLTSEASLRFRTGVMPTSPDEGDMYSDGTDLFYYDGASWVDLTATGGGGSLWSLNGSDVYYNTGNVGIGTSTPSQKLTLNGGNFLHTPGAPVHAGAIFDDGPGGSILLEQARGIYVVGQYAYVTGYFDDGVEILDVSDPTNPVQVGNIADDGTTALLGPAGIVVGGKYAYVAGLTESGLEVLDISDPSNPTHVGVEFDSDDHPANGLNGISDLYLSGKYLYATAYNESAFIVLDISDPVNPTQVGIIRDDNPSTTELWGARRLHVVGEYAYVSSRNDDGLSIIDVSDPTNPTQVGSIDDTTCGGSCELDGAEGIHVSGKYVYIASFFDDGVSIFDASDPTNPTHVGSIDNTICDAAHSNECALDGAWDIEVAGNYAYVTSKSDDGVEILDISDPTNPTHVDSINNTDCDAAVGGSGCALDGADSIYIAGKYAYMTGANEGVEILDISGMDVPSASIGNILTYNLEVNENVNIDNNLYVNNGLNVGPGGIYVDQGNGITTDGDLIALGMVGIGTTIPTAYLDVAASTTSAASLRIRTGTAPTSPNEGDIYSNGTDLFYHDGSSWVDLTATGGGGGSLWTQTGDDIYYDTGLVGIGLDSPAYDLDVVGNANIAASGGASTLAESEDFNGVTFPPGSWTTGGDEDWERDTFDPQEGAANALSGPITHNGTTWLDVDVTFPADGTVSFWWLVSSEEDYDFLLFCIDNDTCTDLDADEAISGGSTGGGEGGGDPMDWTQVTKAVTAGAHSFRWIYTKDSSASDGDDIGAVDNVVFTSGSASGGNLYVEGNIGIGTTSPTSRLDLPAATTSESSLRVRTGTAPTSPNEGDMYADGTDIFYHDGSSWVDLTQTGGASPWTNGGTYLYPTAGEVLGNSASGGANKLAGIYLGDTSPLYFGSNNDAYMQFNNTSDRLDVLGGPALFNQGRVVDPVPASETVDGTGGFTGLGSAWDVYVQGDYAYVAGYGDHTLTIADVSDPTSPVFVAEITDGDPGFDRLAGVRGVFVQGDYAYVTSYNEDALTIIDISDPSSPVFVSEVYDGDGTFNRLNGAHDVYVQGDYAYVAAQIDNAITIIDISDPNSPVLMSEVWDADGEFSHLENLRQVFVSGNYAYVASYQDDALTIMDISDPADPSLASVIVDGVGGFTRLNAVSGVYVQGDYAYVGSIFDDGFTVVDVSDPTNPGLMSQVWDNDGEFSRLDGEKKIHVSGDYAYVVTLGDDGFTIIDISDPTDPDLVSESFNGDGKFTELNNPTELFVLGNYVYMSVYIDNALVIADIGGFETVNSVASYIKTDELRVEKDLFVGNDLTAGSAYFADMVGVGVPGPTAQLDLKAADSNQASLRIRAGSQPSSPNTGDLYSNGVNLFYYNGSSWDDLTAAGGGGGGSEWTDPGSYVYPTENDDLGNPASSGLNKLTGAYFGDSNPLTLGAQNDVSYAFSGSALAVTMGNNDINYDANTLFIDGSADHVGVGLTSPTAFLDLAAATSSEASLRIRSGSQPSVPNTGDFYSNGTDLYFYNGSGWDDLTAGTSTLFSDSGTAAYLTSSTKDFSVGGTGPTLSAFYVDESANTVRIGADGYINFGTTFGENSYGFRDNGGTMQYKDSGQSWLTFDSLGEELWTENGSDIYFNTGGVAIGATVPTAFLDLPAADASDASLRIRSGSAPTVPNQGDIYSTGTDLLYYNGSSWDDLTAAGGGGGSTNWTDPGAYIYPTESDYLGNNTSGGGNKLTGIYLGDSSPIYFGADNDAYLQYNQTTDRLELIGGKPIFTEGRITDPKVVGQGYDGDGEFGLLDGAYDVFVKDNYAYVPSVTDSSVTIIDISDPTNPDLISETADGTGGFSELGGAQGIWVDGKYAYVASGGDDSFTIMDISDPASPSMVSETVDGDGSFTALDGAIDVHIQGHYAFVAAGTPSTGSMTIIDIASPSSPIHMSQIEDGVGGYTKLERAERVFVHGDYAYVTSLHDDAVTIVNVSDKSNPSLVTEIVDGVGGFNYLDGASGIFVAGDYAYVGAIEDNAMSIIDISDPANPVLMDVAVNGVDGFYGLNNCRSIRVAGNYAYITDVGGSFSIIDVSDPSDPVMKGSASDVDPGGPWVLEGAISSAISGNYAYVVSTTDGGFTVIDISATEVSNLYSSNFKAGSALIENNLTVGNDLILQGDLTADYATLTTGLTVNDEYVYMGNLSSGAATNIGVDVNGKVIQVTSSQRYKKDIVNLEIDSELIYDLRPVSFTWKAQGLRDFGVVAEEVDEIIPELVNYNNQGEPESVKYSQLAVLLLEEVKKQRDQVMTIAAATGDEDAMNELSVRLTGIEDTLDQIEIQMDEIRDQIDEELHLAQIESNSSDIEYLQTLLGIDRVANPEDVDILGKLTAAEVESEENQTTRLVIEVVDDDAPTIGSAEITAVEVDEDDDGIDDETGSDGKSIVVETEAATADVEIFITPKQVIDQPLAVTDIEEGESFTVEAKDSLDEDVEFSWWIVEVK